MEGMTGILAGGMLKTPWTVKANSLPEHRPLPSHPGFAFSLQYVEEQIVRQTSDMHFPGGKTFEPAGGMNPASEVLQPAIKSEAGRMGIGGKPFHHTLKPGIAFLHRMIEKDIKRSGGSIDKRPGTIHLPPS